MLHEALLDLAYDVSSYLRHHARATVRVSAALLVAASLAACGPSPATPGTAYSAVQPLTQEVRLGLPNQPGRYPIVPGSLGRDAQGVYHFAWRRPGDPSSVQNYASASLVQLAQGTTSELAVPAQGNPSLYLPPDAAIPLVSSANDLRTPVPGGGGGYYPLWHPFYGGYRGPGYYDPPSGTVAASGTVDGARVSSAPAPPAQRTVGLSRAVSGRAGGTGSGVAATNKSGATTSGVDHGGAAAAKSGSFSAGQSAGSGGSSSS
jgi:hypothetical protein